MRFIVCFFAFAAAFTLCAQNSKTDLLSYIDPFIGTDAHGHTYPGPVAPFGMVQLGPDTRLEGWDGCSGYHFSDTIVYGFSHTHLSGTGVGDYCDILFMPFTGKASLKNTEYASPFKKKQETATAGYYSVFLEKDKIKAELTTTERTGMHRYTFPKNRENAHILVDLRHRDMTLDASLNVVSDREISGHRVSKAWANEQHVYFVARFSKPFKNSKLFDAVDQPATTQRAVKSTQIIGFFDFDNADDAPLVITVGISAVSIENARLNLEAENPGFDFDAVRKSAQDKWRAQLQRTAVEGGTEEQKRAFYTALYHTSIVPNLYSDVNGEYRGRDQKMHLATGYNYYTVFSLWDTYRACKPLYSLLEPKRYADFIRTFLDQYQQGGLLPVWELSACETDCMIGNHAIPIIADAYLKGFRNFDAEMALKAMVKSATEPRYGLPLYMEKGYIPSDKEPESVSKTLEYAFDDWCIAQMAKAMGQKDVYQNFMRRAQSYRHIFDPSTGFFRARNNETWHVPFDPAEVNFNYTEANAWQYRFATPQDISGFMDLLGGPTAFAAQLDALFTAPAQTTGRTQADITGLIGQYAHGNEPSHHIAYLYNYAGQPAKTQAMVHRIMEEMYTDKPDGLSGNEDCGQMSAWLVWSAMGLYPVVPAGGDYAIGSPLFEKITLQVGDGKTLTIRAKGLSKKNIYIKSAQWNGVPYTKTWINHAQLQNGGELTFEMSSEPTQWGTAKSDWPVSKISALPVTAVPFIAKGDRVFQDKQLIELGCLDKNAAIYYREEPSKEAFTPYTKPILMKKSGLLRFYAVANGEKSPEATAEFSKMQPNLKVMQYNTQYNNQYTGRGETGLIDLLRGGADFRSGGWQGYEGVNLDVVLDLGKKKTVKSVTASFLQDENAWIFLPEKAEVYASQNGKDFTLVGTYANEVPASDKGIILKDFTCALKNVKARYLRVVGVNMGKCPTWHKGAGYPSWIFADEIFVE